ncbi:MAG: hypothetical protein AAGB34_07580 [Planctomycetota bacterium]
MSTLAMTLGSWRELPRSVTASPTIATFSLALIAWITQRGLTFA